MKLEPRSEEYLKLLFLHEEDGEKFVKTTALARELGVTPGTITQRMKKFSEQGLVKYEPYQGVALTGKGRGIARSVVRKHRVFEKFLHDILGMDEQKAHEQAGELEHSVDDKTIDRLHQYLDYADKSINGREIPCARKLSSLLQVEQGQKGKVMCVSSGGACVISKLLGLGIAPGAEFTLVKKVSNGPVVLRIGNSEVAIGRGIARRVKVVIE